MFRLLRRPKMSRCECPSVLYWVVRSGNGDAPCVSKFAEGAHSKITVLIRPLVLETHVGRDHHTVVITVLEVVRSFRCPICVLHRHDIRLCTISAQRFPVEGGTTFSNAVSSGPEDIGFFHLIVAWVHVVCPFLFIPSCNHIVLTSHKQCDNYNLKKHRYLCITTYQPDTQSNPSRNPNSDPTTKQHAIVNIQLNIVTCPTYPDYMMLHPVYLTL